MSSTPKSSPMPGDLRPATTGPGIPGTAGTAAGRVRRAGAVIDGNRCWGRLLSLARWAFPDIWTAFAGSESAALAVLGRWPHLRSLALAR
ncbi:hypothetical protein [[Micrococcus luteus] ATCC 49442]|uniref:hypothetical protein n=1 Tax=[Micrococcus luteus] ATCC 49442 TaxID=2698727 RepID=UPI001AD65D88|nr:hypothetical protein [[Micrococcus luteus] ATCC 49442]